MIQQIVEVATSNNRVYLQESEERPGLCTSVHSPTLFYYFIYPQLYFLCAVNSLGRIGILLFIEGLLE